MAGLDDIPPAESPDAEAYSARVSALLADLVEPAKSEAHDKLGLGERAVAIAAGWLNSKRRAGQGPDPGSLRPQ